MNALGIILIIVGGAIFAAGEGNNFLLIIIGIVINILGIGLLIGA